MYDVKDLKERLKKANDMAKKNENKVFMKKSKINQVIKLINDNKDRVETLINQVKNDFGSFKILVKN